LVQQYPTREAIRRKFLPGRESFGKRIFSSVIASRYSEIFDKQKKKFALSSPPKANCFFVTMEHTVPYLKVEGVDNQDPIFSDRYIAVSTSFLWHFFFESHRRNNALKNQSKQN
jgi:hypothetical protein